MNSSLNNKISISLLIWLTFSPIAYANNDFIHIDNYIKENKKIIGLEAGTAIAIIKDGEIIHEGYFGYEDIEAERGVDSNTSFYIASMTKPFFALATLLKAYKGEINTNDSLTKLFPKLHFTQIKPNDIKVKHLLSHTSGIDNLPLVLATAYSGQYTSESKKKIIENSYENAEFPLGEFEYSNVGYNILSQWFERKYNAKWQDTLIDSVIAPIGAKRTSPYISDAKQLGWSLAKGYSVKSDNKKVPVHLSKMNNTMHAAGGMISNVKDLSNFLIAHLNYGKINGKQVFPSEVIEKSHEELVKFTEHGIKKGYSWGWFIQKLNGYSLYEHRGGFSGAHTYMSFMPEKGIGLVVLTSQDKWGGDLAFAIEKTVYSQLLGMPIGEVKKILNKRKLKAISKARKFYQSKLELAEVYVPLENATNKYQGRYTHELLGNIDITVGAKEQLMITFGNLASILLQNKNTNELFVHFIPNNFESFFFKNDKTIEYQGIEFIKH